MVIMNYAALQNSLIKIFEEEFVIHTNIQKH